MTLSRPALRLVKFEPDNQVHVDEFSRQRIVRLSSDAPSYYILCGWGLPYIDFWRGQVRDGDKSLQWLFPLEGEEHLFPFPEAEILRSGEPGPPPPTPSFQPIGHISIDWVDDKDDPTLASKADGTITLATFFILKSQQGKKLGSVAMDLAEDLARELGAKVITLNTFPSANTQRREFWDELSIPYNPERLDLEKWYARRGYEVYQTRNIYPFKNAKTGVTTILDLVFMKKNL